MTIDENRHSVQDFKKIRDTQASIFKKNGIYAILTLCFTVFYAVKTGYRSTQHDYAQVLCGRGVYVTFNIIKSQELGFITDYQSLKLSIDGQLHITLRSP